MKWSIASFIAALVVGFLGMGALGAVLYYACYPLLAPFYGDLDDWHGDWVWPATIGVGMVWSASFLAAGWLDLSLAPRASRLVRGLVYILVLWLGAALIWAVFLLAAFEPRQRPARSRRPHAARLVVITSSRPLPPFFNPRQS